MKALATSTVRKALAGLGFSWHEDAPYPLAMTFVGMGAGQTLFVVWDGRGNIEFKNARWTEGPNVHIHSHFGWPRDGAELQHMLAEVRRIYGTLCAIRFQ